MIKKMMDKIIDELNKLPLNEKVENKIYSFNRKGKNR